MPNKGSFNAGWWNCFDSFTAELAHVDSNLSNHPLFLEQQLEIARLGAMRQVALRRKISELQQRGPVNPDEKLLTKIAQMEVLLHEYRNRFEEETGHRMDEKEVLFG